MPCRIKVDTHLKLDMCDLGLQVRREIYQFLLELQENPLPAGRRELEGNAFYVQLASGCYISWEVSGDLAKLIASRSSEETLIRLLGASFAKPNPK